MRWKLLRRRLSVTAPRVTVRSRLPWPLRWVSFALVLGFSAALALWAYETGKEFAGVDRSAAKEVVELREELAKLKEDHQRALSIANSADSLLKAERTSQDSLAARVKALEAENLALTRDLAFAEKMGPGSNGGAKLVSVRGLAAELQAVGKVHYQALLVLQQNRSSEFKGRCELQLTGTLDGRPWILAAAKTDTVNLKPYQRLEGVVDFPAKAVLKQLDVKVLDNNGKVIVTESVRL
jgi:hypothetical protein